MCYKIIDYIAIGKTIFLVLAPIKASWSFFISRFDGIFHVHVRRGSALPTLCTELSGSTTLCAQPFAIKAYTLYG